MCEELCRTIGLHSVAGSIFTVMVVGASPLRAFRRTWGNVLRRTCGFSYHREFLWISRFPTMFGDGFLWILWGTTHSILWLIITFPTSKWMEIANSDKESSPMNSGRAQNRMERQIWRYICIPLPFRDPTWINSGTSRSGRGVFKSMNNEHCWWLVAVVYPQFMSTWQSVFFLRISKSSTRISGRIV